VPPRLNSGVLRIMSWAKTKPGANPWAFGSVGALDRATELLDSQLCSIARAARPGTVSSMSVRLSARVSRTKWNMSGYLTFSNSQICGAPAVCERAFIEGGLNGLGSSRRKLETVRRKD